MTEPAQITCSNAAIVKRRGDERAVTTCLGEPRKVFGSANPSTGNKHRARRRASDCCDHVEVKSRRASDPSQIEDDQRADARVFGAFGEAGCVKRWLEQTPRQWDATVKVETERDAVTAELLTDCRQRVERIQCFEPDDGPRAAEPQRMSRPYDRRYPAVEPERRHACELFEDRGLNAVCVRPVRYLPRLPICDSVEIRRIQLGNTQAIDIRARECNWIPVDRASSRDADSRVAAAHAVPRVHGHSAGKVDHTYHFHGRLSGFGIRDSGFEGMGFECSGLEIRDSGFGV